MNGLFGASPPTGRCSPRSQPCRLSHTSRCRCSQRSTTWYWTESNLRLPRSMPGGSDADPVPPFIEVCRTHWDEIGALLAIRHVQTNDCGRSALVVPGLTWLASKLGSPPALIDVGAVPDSRSSVIDIDLTTATVAPPVRQTRQSWSRATWSVENHPSAKRPRGWPPGGDRPVADRCLQAGGCPLAAGLCLA